MKKDNSRIFTMIICVMGFLTALLNLIGKIYDRTCFEKKVFEDLETKEEVKE